MFRTALVAAFLLLPCLSAFSIAQTTAAGEEPTQTKPTSCPECIKRAWMKLGGHYGDWWNSLTEDGRAMFLDGFLEAMGRARSLTLGFHKQNVTEMRAGDPEFQAKFNATLTLMVLAEDFDFTVDAPLRTRVDDFYKDERNARIPPIFALRYLRDQMKGKKTEGQLLDDLNRLRRISAPTLPDEGKK